jgi:hypothetical protein
MNAKSAKIKSVIGPTIFAYQANQFIALLKGFFPNVPDSNCGLTGIQNRPLLALDHDT